MKNHDDLIADVIDDGADYIEKYGWFRGDLYQVARRIGVNPNNPPACFMGGLIAANTMDTGHVKAQLYFIVQRIQEVIPEISAVSAWNDNVAKDKQEVLDTMRLAAKRIRMGDGRE